MPNSTLLNFSQFINSLEWHAQNTDIFFDDGFLRLLSKSFQLKDMAITVYLDGEYVSAETCAYGRAVPLVNPYQKGFHQKDFVSQYISKHLNSLLFDDTSAVVRSNHLNNPEGHKAYCDFLGLADMQFTAVLPINETFRLSIYKTREQGEFSDQEIALFNCLLSVLRNKYRSFSVQRSANRAASIIKSLLDNIGIGYIILDGERQISEHNINAVQYLQSTFSVPHITKAVPILLELLSGKHSITYGDYCISMFPYTEVDGLGSIQKYYYLAIQPSLPAASRRPSALSFELLTARELEVLDYFSKGYEYPEISKVLFISEGTLKTHLKNIYRKLGVSNQRRLVYEYSAYLSTCSHSIPSAPLPASEQSELRSAI